MGGHRLHGDELMPHYVYAGQLIIICNKWITNKAQQSEIPIEAVQIGVVPGGEGAAV